MSFKCGVCGSQTKPNEKATRIVTEVREVEYPPREYANVFIRSEKVGDVWVKGKTDFSDDPGGVGLQIAREVLACKQCSILT